MPPFGGLTCTSSDHLAHRKFTFGSRSSRQSHSGLAREKCRVPDLQLDFDPAATRASSASGRNGRKAVIWRNFGLCLRPSKLPF